jgi:hypothetical protein
MKIKLASLLVISLGCFAYPLSAAPDSARGPGATINSQDGPAAQERQKPPKEVLPPPNQTPKAKSPKAPKQETPPPGMQEKKGEKEQQKKPKDLSKQDEKQEKHSTSKGGRIPDDKFKAHLGQAHPFHAKQVITTTRIVPNQTRFVYVGYTFIFVDPWPEGWLLADDCYIDYVGEEYFLFDAMHPGMRVALVVAG